MVQEGEEAGCGESVVRCVCAGGWEDVCGGIDFRPGNRTDATIPPRAIESGFDDLVVPDAQECLVRRRRGEGVGEDDEEVWAVAGCAE